MSIDATPLLFAGSSHPVLAKQIAENLGLELSNAKLGLFSDGEISVQILDNVRGRDVFLLQTVAVNPNFYLMELLIMIDAMKRASARTISAVIPYFGYSRQDRKDKPRVPITAKLVANLLEKAGATRVLTMDLHAEQIQGFFDIPVDNLYSRPSLISAIHSLHLEDFVVVAPDVGSIKLARAFSRDLHAELAVLNKRRKSSTEIVAMTLLGEVKGRNVLLVDDMCSTGETLAKAAKSCCQAGALHVYAAVAHGLLVGGALRKLEESPLEILIVGNSVPLETEGQLCRLRLEVVSLAQVFAEAIRCVVFAKSISSLFGESSTIL